MTTPPPNDAPKEAPKDALTEADALKNAGGVELFDMSPDARAHLDRLADRPQAVHIFHALRVLEAAYADNPRLGESRRPRDDRVRLAQVPEMAFPETTLARFQKARGTKPALLINKFFGFFGSHGPLPLHVTDYARTRLRNHRDRTMVDFTNIFTHRMLSLLYRAWASAEPAPSADRREHDPFADQVAALAGYKGEALTERDAMTDLSKRYFAGHLASGAKHAEGLAAMVGAIFKAPARIEEFVGTWLRLEPSDQWQLGRPGGLGFAHNLGEEVWSRATKFRLRIGPVDLKGYKALLPGTTGFTQLQAVVRNYAGDAMEWDLVLVLRGQEVPEARLGQGLALGHTSWIGLRPEGRDADDLRLTG